MSSVGAAVYIVTVAVVALEIVPYAKDTLTALLGYWMLTAPLVGAALAGFGVALVNNELAIFANVKFAFHLMQNRFLDTVMPDDESKRAAKHPIRPSDVRHTRFDL